MLSSYLKIFYIFNLPQDLITQYRSRIIELQQQSGVGPAPMAKISNATDVKETIRQLEIENVGIITSTVTALGVKDL